ncbi:MAG: hypothetical protein QXS48_03145 [Candidatus Aenigmatarchaeota archaeon]
MSERVEKWEEFLKSSDTNRILNQEINEKYKMNIEGKDLDVYLKIINPYIQENQLYFRVLAIRLEIPLKRTPSEEEIEKTIKEIHLLHKNRMFMECYVKGVALPKWLIIGVSNYDVDSRTIISCLKGVDEVVKKYWLNSIEGCV